MRPDTQRQGDLEEWIGITRTELSGNHIPDNVVVQASARGLAEYLAPWEAEALLAYLPLRGDPSPQWSPETWITSKVHWGLLAEALPCNAVDFVCRCLIEAEIRTVTRSSYFFSSFEPGTRAVLEEILHKMRNMQDPGGNRRFLAYPNLVSVPSSTHEASSLASLVVGSTEWSEVVERSFRTHATGTGASEIQSLAFSSPRTGSAFRYENLEDITNFQPDNSTYWPARWS